MESETPTYALKWGHYGCSLAERVKPSSKNFG
eukprot:CAMPEP_0174295476 /NCGR_PEP_ID=MMETSP0809-20121228/44827_1 /TAXON_ID=73025 ORGANISM="Eutreptiella gymnastica-like, Strain CCMP1594" /NCGR_SAMPLE_ID=MMETSP0809 /ASSEMBLY_ACC=CAM_ASM_000658 /LENGTH=31 /DNA_ID= /DNA_START= /DNA_END= /DNA_ORIENTATION=